MGMKERLLYIGLIVVLLAGGLYTTWRWLDAKTPPIPADTSNQEALLRAAEAKVTALEAQLATEQRKVEELTREQVQDPGRPIVLLGVGDLRDLQAKGLTDPANQIAADLATRPDLIPIGGVLGGTMTFHPSSQWVVSYGWVLADFDDGHIVGRGIFRYTVEGGKITWSLLDWGQP